MPSTLNGITVLDLTQNIAGPYCTQLLGDFGATVIKVERPGVGDDVRRFAPEWQGEGTGFLCFNRNKRSVAIDLNDPRGQSIVKRLATRADVFIESMKPGSMDARGLGYEDLSRLNPRQIYASISGFGDHGPLRNLPGYDPLGQAYSGIMSITGHPGAPPARVVVPIIDQGTGMWVFIGIMAALMERAQTGKGARVAGSLLETGVTWTSLFLTNYLATGKVPERSGSASPAAAPYEAFQTADGWAMIAAGTDRLFGKLCETLALLELPADLRFNTNNARTEHRAPLHELLEERTRTIPTASLLERLQLIGVPCSPINTIDRLVTDEQVEVLGMIKDAPADFRIPGFKMVDIPVSINDQRAEIALMPPRLGEHTDQVLLAAGYSIDEIAQLKLEKVLG